MQAGSLGLNSASVGTLAGLAIAYILPGEHTWLKTMIAGTVGHLFFTLLQGLPSVRDVLRWYARKPNAVYISAKGPIYGKLETYIVNRYVDQIRACELQPRNGKIRYSIDRVQFHRPLFDEYQGAKVQLRLLRANGAAEITAESFRSLFRLRDLDDCAAGARDVTEGAASSQCAVIVSSWTLTVPQLRGYIDALCEFRSDAQVTPVYVPKIVGYGGGEKSDASAASRARNALLEWDTIHVKSNTRLSNTILSRDVARTLVDDVATFMRSEEWYNAKGMPYKRGWLLTGAPGTGKTSVIKAIAAEYRLPVFTVDFGIVTTNMQFSRLMKDINHHTNNKPYIVACEDFDRCNLLGDRYGRYDDDSDRKGITVSCLLNEIDGLVESHGRLLFLTANDGEKLKSIDQNALMRPGRIDQTVEITYCDFDQVQRLLFHFYGLHHDVIADLQPADLNGKYTPATVVGLLQKHARDDPPEVVICKLFRRATGVEGELDAEAFEALVPCAERKRDPLSRAERMLLRHADCLRRDKRVLATARRTLKYAQKRVDNKEKTWADTERKLEKAKVAVTTQETRKAKRYVLTVKSRGRVKELRKEKQRVDKEKQRVDKEKQRVDKEKEHVDKEKEHDNAPAPELSEGICTLREWRPEPVAVEPAAVSEPPALISWGRRSRRRRRRAA